MLLSINSLVIIYIFKTLIILRKKNIMKTFDEIVSEYMQCDKKTLAEMLALRDLYKGDNSSTINAPIQPYNPYQPWYPINCPSKKDEEPWRGYKIWCGATNDYTTVTRNLS